jgi:hypothetical protein
MSQNKAPTEAFMLDGDTLPLHLQNPVSDAPMTEKQGVLFTMYRDAKPNKTARHIAPTLMDWLSDNLKK